MVESSRSELSLCFLRSGRGILNRGAGGQDEDSSGPIRHNGAMTMTDDDIIRLIENFKFDAGPVAVEWRNRGFTLIHAETGVPCTLRVSGK